MGRLRVLEMHLRYLENAVDTDDILFPPSSIGPDTYWTSQDKALFFTSITRHSRWRPDLIAEDLGGTKTVGDIWAYIQLLDEGSVAHPPVPSDDPPLSAREMSDKWVANEEELANEIISNEGKWRHHTNLKARRDHLHALSESLAPEEEMSAEPPLYPHDPRSFDEQKKSLKRIWSKEDLISKLDLSLLKRMDYLSHGISDARRRSRRSRIKLESHIPSAPRKATPLEYKPISIPDLSSLTLTPLERKRLRQRLWLRQKRAIQSGLSPSKASTYLGKIKAGPRFSKPKSDSQNKKTNAAISVKANKGGDSSKINRDPALERYDITKDTLFKDGLDVFHLEKFAILPSLFEHVFGSGNPELGDRYLIAYDMLCYLRACLVQFLTSVIGMAITHRRTSIRQRRIDEFIPDIDASDFQISSEDVLASLLSLGQSVDKDYLFERMYAILRSRQDGGAVSDRGEQNIRPNPVKTPFMANELSLLANPSILAHEDIPIDIDEKELLQDLASEEALEQKYMLADQKYENRLWVGEDDGMEAN